ncbi:2-dehydro-3-deoxygalactonokinase [Pseudomonas sp. RIT-PI-S]|uniref:2-dehydro-3-deoxygalactonokinase n=1 Tax=Pseudomonas sp. RIT-PI-S TaxID=3035295 RepID=UPI0021DA47FC|nr:2-dehydro-3-deoxygalactonokinase [Pseudomonas sp. RIT-PI-S]
MQARLIGLDWGTSSLRAYRFGAGGRVLETRERPLGIMQVPSGGFDQALDEACGDWRRDEPGLPLIACGMIGSAQGWHEVPYCLAPASAGDLAQRMLAVSLQGGGALHIVPGVLQQGALPNVMRGEETQVLGLLQAFANSADRQPPLIGLPGTHSKWVRADEGCIRHFDTFMTGELYAAACAHTILGRTQQRPDSFQAHAFDRGVAVATSAEGRLGVLATLFSARTLGLTGALAPTEQPDYLSGLMIGHEIAALAGAVGKSGAPLPGIVLIGSAPLCQRYQRALHACGFAHVQVAEQATERGLWLLATTAGLVQP